MSLVNLTDTDIFVNKLTFGDGTSQTVGLNPTNLEYYDIPPITLIPQGVFTPLQLTDPFAVGIYMVHYKIQLFTPDDNAMTNIQMNCFDTTTALEIQGSIFNFNVTTSVQSNMIRSIDKTVTFLWNNLTIGNTFTLQSNVSSFLGGAGWNYQLATGGVIQLIKIG
jgi:hypothetical protein